MDQALKEAAVNPEKVVVLFADESSFYRQPSQAWLWASMGRRQPKVRYTSGANTVMRLLGLMDAAKARVKVWDFPRIGGKEVARCFRKIGALYPEAETIYLVMDNWPPHLHDTVKEALASEPRIRVLFLPTYAPWLNNIEKLWKWLRQRVEHVHPWCDDFRVFREHILAECTSLGAGSPELRRFCGLDRLFSA